MKKVTPKEYKLEGGGKLSIFCLNSAYGPSVYTLSMENLISLFGQGIENCPAYYRADIPNSAHLFELNSDLCMKFKVISPLL